MASVTRDMTIASLLVVAIAGSVLTWNNLMSSERQAEATVVEPGRPGIVTAIGEARSDSVAATARRQVVVRIASYRPPEQGAVQIIVRALRNGGENALELGRFALFPNTAFTSQSEQSRRSYAVPARGCPSDQSQDCSLRLEITIAPVSGSGAGAWLTLGAVAIEWR